MEKYGRSRQATDVNIIWRMRFAWWVTKTTDTHSEYVTIIAFRRQNWLSGRASNLCLDLTLRMLLHKHLTITRSDRNT